MKTDWIIFCGLILRQKKPRDCFTVVSYTTTERNLYFSVSEVILVFHIAILREKPNKNIRGWWKSIEKLFNIPVFMINDIFCFFESPKRRKLKQPKETRTCLTTVHLVRKTVKCFSEIVDLCNNNRTELTLMMDRNYSICCYSTYHCKIFPGPVGLNTRGTPHLFVVVISPPIRYHLNRCDKFNVWYVYLIIGQISFWWQTRRKFILN